MASKQPWAIIWEDKYLEPQVELFSDRQAAVDYAAKLRADGLNPLLFFRVLD